MTGEIRSGTHGVDHVTSSASTSKVGGTLRPSALAALVSRQVSRHIRPAYSSALAWLGLNAPPAPAHPVGRNVEHPV
jgi:hypothetical protein